MGGGLGFQQCIGVSTSVYCFAFGIIGCRQLTCSSFSSFLHTLPLQKAFHENVGSVRDMNYMVQSSRSVGRQL